MQIETIIGTQFESMILPDAIKTLKESYDYVWKKDDYTMHKVLKLWYDEDNINAEVVNCRCYYSSVKSDEEIIYWNAYFEYTKKTNKYEFISIANEATETDDGLDSSLTNFKIYYDVIDELIQKMLSPDAIKTLKESYNMDKVLKLWYDENSINDAVVTGICKYSDETNKHLYALFEYTQISNKYSISDPDSEIDYDSFVTLLKFKIYYDLYYEEFNKLSLKIHELSNEINNTELQNNSDLMSKLTRSNTLLGEISALISDNNSDNAIITQIDLAIRFDTVNKIITNINNYLLVYSQQKYQKELTESQEESKIHQLELNSIKVDYYKSILHSLCVQYSNLELTEKNTVAVEILTNYYYLLDVKMQQALANKLLDNYANLKDISFYLAQVRYYIDKAKDPLYDSDIDQALGHVTDITQELAETRVNNINQKYIIDKYQLKELLTSQLIEINSKFEIQNKAIKEMTQALYTWTAADEAFKVADEAFKVARQNPKRYKNKYMNNKLYSDTVLDQAQETLDQAQETLDQAQETLDQAQETLDQAKQKFNQYSGESNQLIDTLGDANNILSQVNEIFSKIDSNKSTVEAQLADVKFRLAKAQLTDINSEIIQFKKKIGSVDQLDYKIEQMRLFKCFKEASDNARILGEKCNNEDANSPIRSIESMIQMIRDRILTSNNDPSTSNDDPSTIQSAQNDSWGWGGPRMGPALTLAKGVFDLF
jgi:hypothetical protein